MKDKDEVKDVQYRLIVQKAHHTYNSFSSTFLDRKSHLKEGKDDFNSTASLGNIALKLPDVVNPLTEEGLEGSV